MHLESLGGKHRNVFHLRHPFCTQKAGGARSQLTLILWFLIADERRQLEYLSHCYVLRSAIAQKC